MLFNELLEAVNGKTLQKPTDHRVWTEASDRLQVHARGIRPRFKSQRKTGRGGWVTPANYEERFQYLFDDYILNRHPNENVDHYYWRLSTFPLIAQEIYLNAKSQICGVIFQENQYEIRAHEKSDQEFLDEMQFDKYIREQVPEHILTDPFGKFAVVEGHFEDFGTDSPAFPRIEKVEARHIRHWKPKESICFQASELHNGKILLYWIDRNWCVKLINVGKSKNVEEFRVLSSYEHGFGELPVIDNDTNFFQKFVSWADMLARNISDDEVIAKNASYPHKQVVEPTCNVCMGARKVPSAGETDSTGVPIYHDCTNCNGRGTISVNPGEVYVVKERDRNDQRPIEDYVRFINPDISINDFSFKRWQQIYDFGMRSLHLKYVEEAQSGIAKAIDRDQLQFLVSNFSTKIFEVTSGLMKYCIAYLNLTVVEGQLQHILKDFTVTKPKQFQIKTEYDLQNEYTELITKGADLMVRRSKLEEYYKKTFAGNVVELKKFEAIKLFDWLYGMTDEELQSRKIIGSAKTNDFIKHDRAEFLINQIISEKGEEFIANKLAKDIAAEMETLVKPMLVPEGLNEQSLEDELKNAGPVLN